MDHDDMVTKIDNSDDDDVVSNIFSKKGCWSLSQCPISIEIILLKWLLMKRFVCSQDVLQYVLVVIAELRPAGERDDKSWYEYRAGTPTPFLLSPEVVTGSSTE